MCHHGPVDRPVDLVVEEGGPGVGLDQVDPEVAVQHEVVAQQLVGVVGGPAAALEAELLEGGGGGVRAQEALHNHVLDLEIEK